MSEEVLQEDSFGNKIHLMGDCSICKTKFKSCEACGFLKMCGCDKEKCPQCEGNG